MPTNSNSLDYGYTNPIPGSNVGAPTGGQIPDSQVVSSGPQVVTANPFASAVGRKTESGQFDGNAAFGTASELQRDPGGAQDGFTQPLGNRDPEAPNPVAQGDRDNPVALENQGDEEAQLSGEGLGDALAGARPVPQPINAAGIRQPGTPST